MLALSDPKPPNWSPDHHPHPLPQPTLPTFPIISPPRLPSTPSLPTSPPHKQQGHDLSLKCISCRNFQGFLSPRAPIGLKVQVNSLHVAPEVPGDPAPTASSVFSILGQPHPSTTYLGHMNPLAILLMCLGCLLSLGPSHKLFPLPQEPFFLY